MAKETDSLKERIQELEMELVAKDKELSKYRQELAKANVSLENLIGQITEEIRMAGLIQKMMSPTQLPNISGFECSSKYQPGDRFGGDYFDIFEHEDKLKFGVVVASSSGYTMSALFLSVLIKISSQIEARRGLEPHKMLELLTKELVPNIQNSDKASVFYGVIDRRTYELSYSSVGRVEACLQVYGQESLQTLEACGPAFSRDFNTQPQSLKLQLNPRDRLVIATEGLVGAQNPQGQMWGGEGLRESVRMAPRQGVHELRNEIMHQNEKFTGRQSPLRDQTVIVMEVKDRVIKLAKT
ncbi:PP2C family protein-serine/threonine phosphatase [Bdellovibrio sp. HCB337]|uniref:PP2C family protein-serine/threonine phosphatase n=1 Tax=Bdellovibrio sp. HCB337 TaxID=3394358 RepID=UPI0039A4E88A